MEERKGQTERNRKLNESKDWLREYLQTINPNSLLYRHIKTVAGLGLRGGKTGRSPSEIMRKKLHDTGQLDEYHDIYMPFRWGSTKMKTWMREQIRDRKASEQLFIKYYKTGSKMAGFGVYKLVAVGAVPNNWCEEGNYLPMEMREDI